VIGYGLGMVSGARRHHSLIPFFLSELQEFVKGSPVLERAGPLQVLELPKELAGKLVLKSIRALAGG
jgi:hypothetical protein